MKEIKQENTQDDFSLRQANKLLAEIKQKELVISKTTSKYLKNDYRKAIKKGYKVLRKYCFYNNINYYKLLEN